MPVRTAYAGAAVAGEVLTAANMNKISGGWIGYNEVTTGQGGITTTVDLTGLTVTVTVNSSRRLRITSHTLVASTVGGDIVSLSIVEDGTTVSIGQLAASTSATTCSVSAVRTPVTGSHIYKLALGRAAGSGTLATTASTSVPAFILVEDIGPAT